jgi:hypothetical protein
MSEFVVSTWAQLAAALLAAACSTFEEARRNPFIIVFGTCRYTFNEGLQETRANKLAIEVRRTHRGR